MAKRLQLRGGTTSQHSSFTGAVREVTVDTDKDTLVVHDGSTAGGKALPTLTGTETLTNKTLTSATFAGTATSFRSTGIDDNCSALRMTLTNDATTMAGGLTLDYGSANGNPRINFAQNNITGSSFIEVDRNSLAMEFYNNGSERLRITSAGLVGIGTSSPTHNLTVDGGTSTSVSLIKDASGSATIRYYDGGSQKSYIQLDASENMEFYAASGVEQVFYGNNAEVMRLSSGAVFNETGGDRDFRVESNNNAHMLFVDGGNDTVGIGTGSPETNAKLSVSSDNTKSWIFFERSGSGRNDTAMGNSGGNMVIKTGGDGWSNLAERMVIHSNGVISSANGIALGVGTANTASNVLDDYEEGTWTPSPVSGLSGFNVSASNSTYVKIGSFVLVQMYVTSLAGKNSSQLKIGGLPYTAKAYATGVISAGTSGHQGFVITTQGATQVDVFYANSSDSTRENLLGNDTDNYLILSLGYYTDN